MSSSSDTAMQILKWVPQETGKDNHVCKLAKKCLTKSSVPSQLSSLLSYIIIQSKYFPSSDWLKEPV